MQILCRHKHPTRASANLPRAALDALLFLNTQHKHKMANAKPLAYRRSLVLACLAEAQEDSLKAIEVRAASLPKYFAKALKHPHGPCACTCQLLKTSSCWANWPPPPPPRSPATSKPALPHIGWWRRWLTTRDAAQAGSASHNTAGPA